MASSSATLSVEDSFELYLIWSTQNDDRLPHWMLMIVPPLTEPQRLGRDSTVIKGIRYHSKGGPTEGIPYRVAVDANTNFRSARVLDRKFICHLTARNAGRVAKAANDVQPHQCQKYVVCLLALMEKRQIIPRGHAQALAGRVRMSPRALQYEASYPAPLPFNIELPPAWPMPGNAQLAPVPSPAAAPSRKQRKLRGLRNPRPGMKGRRAGAAL